jgi:serine/threonine-protein kinase
LLGGAAGGVVAANPFATPTYAVPLVVGSSLATAQSLAGAAHGDVLVVAGYGPSKILPYNTVMKQEPTPGFMAAAGTKLHVILSSGPPAVRLPSVVDKTCAQSIAILKRAGFSATCPLSNAAFSATVARGLAIGVYAGNLFNPATAAYGSALIVELSKGPPPVPVPGVVGLPGIQAVSTLQQAGFNPVVRYEFSRLVHAGNVITTVPAATTKLLPGRSVAVFVSKGAPATVPSLGHASLSTAEAIIVHAGLTVVAVHGPTTSHNWTTQPPAGTEVPAGSSVTLYGT